MPNGKMKNNVYALLKCFLILSKPHCIFLLGKCFTIFSIQEPTTTDLLKFLFWRGIFSLALDELPVKSFRVMLFCCCCCCCCFKLNIFPIVIAAGSAKQCSHLLPSLYPYLWEVGESFYISSFASASAIALGFSATKNLKGYLMIKTKNTMIEICVIKMCWIQLNCFYLCF